MKGKTTIKVEDIKEQANRLLAVEDGGTIDTHFRQGVAALVEWVLLQTGNYRGFQYLEWTDGGGCKRWADDGCPDDTTQYRGDKTRRKYY